MEYQERSVQRVFSIRFSPGDRLIDSLEKLAEEKGLHTGIVLVLGAFSQGNLVLGFRKHSKIPRDFDRTSISETHEVVGVGSLSRVNGKPKVHLHSGLAKEREVFIAHIEEADVAGAEAFILELSGTGFTSAALV
jgi:predicted DNA-binding protein with PD1-like motif